MDALRKKKLLEDAHDAAVLLRKEQANYDSCLQVAVEEGVSFVDLGRAVGRTEGAVRMKAKRERWYEPNMYVRSKKK